MIFCAEQKSDDLTWRLDFVGLQLSLLLIVITRKWIHSLNVPIALQTKSSLQIIRMSERFALLNEDEDKMIFQKSIWSNFHSNFVRGPNQDVTFAMFVCMLCLNKCSSHWSGRKIRTNPYLYLAKYTISLILWVVSLYRLHYDDTIDDKPNYSSRFEMKGKIK